jgi:hypothetical protein
VLGRSLQLHDESPDIRGPNVFTPMSNRFTPVNIAGLPLKDACGAVGVRIANPVVAENVENILWVRVLSLALTGFEMELEHPNTVVLELYLKT